MQNVYMVRPEDLATTWPLVEPFINDLSSAMHGDYTSLELVEEIIARRFQLWAMAQAGQIRACYLGRILAYPKFKSYEIMAVAGTDMLKYIEEWKNMLRHTEEWAKEEGCRFLMTHTRPALERLVFLDGYKKTHIILEKVL